MPQPTGSWTYTLATPDALVTEARAHDPRLHGPLVRLAEQIGDTAIVASLLALRSALTNPKSDWFRTSTALAASGAYVSNTESALLEMASHVH